MRRAPCLSPKNLTQNQAPITIDISRTGASLTGAIVIPRSTRTYALIVITATPSLSFRYRIYSASMPPNFPPRLNLMLRQKLPGSSWITASGSNLLGSVSLEV